MNKIALYKNKYLQFPNGQFSSIPENDCWLVIESNTETINLQKYGEKFIIETEKFNKIFNTLEDIVEYLNKNNFISFVGINDL